MFEALFPGNGRTCPVRTRTHKADLLHHARQYRQHALSVGNLLTKLAWRLKFVWRRTTRNFDNGLLEGLAFDLSLKKQTPHEQHDEDFQKPFQERSQLQIFVALILSAFQR